MEVPIILKLIQCSLFIGKNGGWGCKGKKPKTSGDHTVMCQMKIVRIN